MPSYVYAPKGDTNHAEISGYYIELMCLVFDTHTLPGFVDLVVRIPTRGGTVLQMVEIKTDKGAVQPRQRRLQRDWGPACIALVRTQQDVIEHVERVQARARGAV
jgi:hypothetical protein